MKNYDPNKPAANNGRYMGLPFTEKDAKCILLPVPWDVTTSFAETIAIAPEIYRNLRTFRKILMAGVCCHRRYWNRIIWRKSYFRNNSSL